MLSRYQTIAVIIPPVPPDTAIRRTHLTMHGGLLYRRRIIRLYRKEYQVKVYKSRRNK